MLRSVGEFVLKVASKRTALLFSRQSCRMAWSATNIFSGFKGARTIGPLAAAASWRELPKLLQVTTCRARVEIQDEPSKPGIFNIPVHLFPMPLSPKG